MLAKAHRKVTESRFHISALSKAQDVDAAEFTFNALLNSGKSVVNAIHAQVFTIELPRTGGDEQQARARAWAKMRRLVKDWKKTIGPTLAVLYAALQAARNVEVHALGSAARQIAQVEARIVPHPLPALGAAARPAVAGMLFAGALSPEITQFETTFALELDQTSSTKPTIKVLFEQFSRRQRVSTRSAAEEYIELLASLVTYCESRI